MDKYPGWESLDSDLLSTKYTRVCFHRDDRYVPNQFEVTQVNGENGNPASIVGEIKFQSGPIKEAGVNGVMNEDLIAMCIARLEAFQQSEFKCRENAVAITKLEEALMWLRKRTTERENRGVEGTHTV